MKQCLARGLTPALIGLVAALAPATPRVARVDTPIVDMAPLAILYAGTPGSAREADFVRFLGEHFERVETGDFARFAPSDADAFDVVLLDFDGDGFKCPKPKIPRSYARPTITISVAGGLLCNQLRLKTGYL